MRCRARRLVSLVIAGLFVVLLLRMLISFRSLLRVNNLTFFHLDPFGAPRGQYLVDYIAANLEVKYCQERDGKVFITLTNRGLIEIPADNWAIYFSHANGFIPITLRRFRHIEEIGVTIRHLDGWLFSITPVLTGSFNTSFRPLKPNATLVIREEASLKSKSYAFPQWYVSGNGLEPKVIQSTESSRLSFDFKFETWPQESRFLRNKVLDLTRFAKAILPTPLNMLNGSTEIKLDKKWKIAYQKELREEATFIAEKLNMTLIEHEEGTAPNIHTIFLTVRNLSVYFSNVSPSIRLNIEEGYIIRIEQNMIFVHGQSSHGIFYGVQSLISLLDNSKDGSSLPIVEVIDAPRMEYRGLMYDIARHFIEKNEILRILDVMAMYKLNKIHFHLTDDQGWRIEIPTLPELTEIGSRRSHDLKEEYSLLPYFGSGPVLGPTQRQYYSVQDYQDILRHANRRHIEVIPEIDMPGHAHAAIQSMRMRYKRMKRSGSEEASASSYLLHDVNDTSKYLGVNQQTDSVLNPCIESTYTFVQEIVRSLVAIHKDIQPLKTLHLGGDEVPPGALVHSPACNALLHTNPKLAGNLKLYFMKRVITIAYQNGVRIQTWEDGLGHRGEIPIDSSEWKNGDHVAINAWEITPAAFTFANAGYKVILTHAHHLYLDHPYEPDGEERGLFWAARYIDSRLVFGYMYDGKTQFSRKETCRVFNMKDCIELRHPENIIGMQACLWGEMIRTNDDIDYMLYPRLLAFAERAWHMADWETASTEQEMLRLREADWANFANTVGYKELKRLERLGINYRLSTPGIRVNKEIIEVNTEFPGSLIQYSVDGGSTWQTYEAGVKLQPASDIRFSVVSHDLKRRGRVVRWS